MKSPLDYEQGDDGETRHLKSLARAIARRSGVRPDEALELAAAQIAQSRDAGHQQTPGTDAPSGTD
jgi:hypothetical protein